MEHFCGCRTKLEKIQVQCLLQEYDVISLNEIKTEHAVAFPGYVSYRSAVGRSSQRGGTVVVVKNYLAKSMMNVDVCV